VQSVDATCLGQLMWPCAWAIWLIAHLVRNYDRLVRPSPERFGSSITCPEGDPLAVVLGQLPWAVRRQLPLALGARQNEVD